MLQNVILLPKARPAECHPRPPNLLVSNSQRPLFLPSGPNSHSPAIRLNQPLPGRRFTDLGLVICPDPLPLRNCVCQPSHPCLSSRIRQIKACRVTRRLFLSYIKLFCAPPLPSAVFPPFVLFLSRDFLYTNSSHLESIDLVSRESYFASRSVAYVLHTSVEPTVTSRGHCLSETQNSTPSFF